MRQNQNDQSKDNYMKDQTFSVIVNKTRVMFTKFTPPIYIEAFTDTLTLCFIWLVTFINRQFKPDRHYFQDLSTIDFPAWGLETSRNKQHNRYSLLRLAVFLLSMNTDTQSHKRTLGAMWNQKQPTQDLPLLSMSPASRSLIKAISTDVTPRRKRRRRRRGWGGRVNWSAPTSREWHHGGAEQTDKVIKSNR